MTNNAVLSTFTVTMRIGNDTATTTTNVRATDAVNARLVAKMAWSGVVVRILNVEQS